MTRLGSVPSVRSATSVATLQQIGLMLGFLGCSFATLVDVAHRGRRHRPAFKDHDQIFSFAPSRASPA